MIARIVLRDAEIYHVVVGSASELNDAIKLMVEADEGLAFLHFDKVIAKPGDPRFVVEGKPYYISTDLIVALDQISHIEFSEEKNVPRSI